LLIERLLLPGIKYAYTVSEPIAREYKEKYGINFKVIRNFPQKVHHEPKRPDKLKCGPLRIIIYQGSLNPGRGLESMILAMKHLSNFRFQIFGDGPLRKKLERLVEDTNINDRVMFMGRKPFSELRAYTRQASLAVSLEENVGKNYVYALPNKLFDYIQARVPVLVSDLPEMKQIVEKYEAGMVSDTHDPERLAGIINEMMVNDEKRMIWKKNLKKASGELCWENERDKLLEIYRESGLIL
jgi:glycosyltransferase involved in cell wall biosynthesis